MPLISQNQAEDSRAIVERELQKKQHTQSEKNQQPLLAEKDDRGTEAARRRIFDENRKNSQSR
ncbi:MULTISPECIES: hypothetical protein [unclassified Chelatococcus]|uniref:hypothetical protein n=1 Tax=unclassified Chelatococcus TaxID=2638111 RepID=UPI001BD08BE7|nr:MULTISPECIES: hypothetical protein [unclassified Chelatococcus]CAH1653994.1 hypothetical protein CHELA20_11042 [Hyphomicrobiales bacterium]MBS7742840.1 hypothetical protein [Chelatococcus sp. HY11]MBX3542042.1 hypothetical protein [Chelatococcus sp.]MCO5074066.1 hypothetical protein [Chelatococcus sp.]CAH1694721.1 hypothetical protein CHELA41_51273 [Hyphomicrobiales bacterium]